MRGPLLESHPYNLQGKRKLKSDVLIQSLPVQVTPPIFIRTIFTMMLFSFPFSPSFQIQCSKNNTSSSIESPLKYPMISLPAIFGVVLKLHVFLNAAKFENPRELPVQSSRTRYCCCCCRCRLFSKRRCLHLKEHTLRDQWEDRSCCSVS
jgi:hypothetical protein